VLVVAASRPVFIAFDRDRLEVVTAIEIEDEHLAAATNEQFQSRSWLGPKLVAVARPNDAKEKSDLLFFALAGKDAQYQPKYYREYGAANEQVLAKSLPLHSLLEDSGSHRSTLETAIVDTGKSMDDMRWLLVRHRFGFAVALIDGKSAMPLTYLPLDPVWVKGDQAPDRAFIRN
jgi:hypothetical protein